MNAMNESYKKEHERFVSGHDGASYFEASSIFIASVAVCLLRDSFTLILLLSDSKKAHKTSKKYPHRGRFVPDFIFLVITNLLNVTLLSDHVFINLFLILISSAAMFFYYFVNGDFSFQLSSTIDKFNLSDRKSFVTNFRSIVNLLTAISILAVDFKIFPRRFAKTETYGYSIMDAGVGFFVVSNAIVSPEARNKVSLLSWKQQVKKAFISSLPLIILGVARLVSVKGVDYHEHVTEYGVHWNFFFTLASLKIFSSVIFLLPGGNNTLTLGILIVALHQFFLGQGLSAYIVNGADGKGGRQGLIDSNREGIISLPGYFAIYMIGVQLGKFIFRKRSNIREWLHAALYMTAFVIFSSLLMHGLNDFVEPVSRRFSNAAYVFYVISQSCLALTVTLIGDMCTTSLLSMRNNDSKKHPMESPQSELVKTKNESDEQALKISPIFGPHSRRNLHQQSDMNNIDCKNNSLRIYLLDSISFNSLLFFLLANLLTGFVNIAVPTLHVSNLTSLFILLIYLLTLNITVFILYRKGVSTKIW